MKIHKYIAIGTTAGVLLTLNMAFGLSGVCNVDPSESTGAPWEGQDVGGCSYDQNTMEASGSCTTFVFVTAQTLCPGEPVESMNLACKICYEEHTPNGTKVKKMVGTCGVQSDDPLVLTCYPGDQSIEERDGTAITGYTGNDCEACPPNLEAPSDS